MKSRIAFLLLALSLTLGYQACAAASETPERVADAYINAIRTEGLVAVPAYIHPDEL